MSERLRTIPTSLRGRLGATAMAGLLTSGLLIGLLLYTAWTAGNVVRTGMVTHDRVRLYTLLLETARGYQNASYKSVREPSDRADWEVLQQRQRLKDVLEDALSLPAADKHDRQVAPAIEQQVEAVIEHFRNAERLVQSVDAQWQTGGSRAALMEVSRVSAPIFELQDTLQAEVRRGDRVIGEATRKAQQLISLAVIGSFVAFILAVGFWLAFHALLHLRLRPGLQQLEAGAQAFAGGHLEHRIGLSGRDELAELSGAFDKMAETIAEKQAALHEIQVGLERAVAERTEELQKANAELFAADERRRIFLAEVGHELRTPLTVIRGETQVALRIADQPDFDPQDVFERIHELTRDLSRMVDDLFLIARAEAGGLPLDREILDLSTLAERAASDFDTLVNERGGSIRMTAGGSAHACVDANRVRRALAALIENALQHCQQEVNIAIEAGEENGYSFLAVRDDGPGVDPSQAAELFRRFRRGNTSGEGSGLGLSLVSALVEAHGGMVDLTRMPDGGTRATMFFAAVALEQEAA